jgi:hypothetical protein
MYGGRGTIEWGYTRGVQPNGPGRDNARRVERWRSLTQRRLDLAIRSIEYRRDNKHGGERWHICSCLTQRRLDLVIRRVKYWRDSKHSLEQRSVSGLHWRAQWRSVWWRHS